ncbi:2OG-Fe dioxygenase family protein [uncultured Aquimonas sp.]|uniref:2OG-Fe dioxygenase family protein n=1 Tax=uncultured Aquimonas sp. TaxID=385483 RepID=UPI00086AE3FD|nr:2OG-Fe dioxygenase family protein [uncultured Aquimonas sp.]ODU43683.1 MAG: hypothetical protein ABS96_22225 [Xanthomonadaceae bacterium SCN 69-123]
MNVSAAVHELDHTLLALGSEGFCFLPCAQALALLPAQVDVGWEAFARSWSGLGLDEHMADGGRYRRRRHAVFAASRARGIERLRDAPHYQALHYNRLNGGIERWFQPILPDIADSAAFRALSEFAHALFSKLAPEVERWQIEAHQFRIEALPGQPGQPTPEGVHRDGVDYVLVALVDRHNIHEGTTTIHAADGTQLGAFTLTEALDIALVDDQRVWHGVTAVEPLDPDAPAWRDVLVLTFRRAEAVRSAAAS